jgi:hypothetical protein
MSKWLAAGESLDDVNPRCASASGYLVTDPENPDGTITVPFVDYPAYYYYNWPYVDVNKATMCEEPWRVPDKADLSALQAATTKSRIHELWGKEPGSLWGTVADPGTGFVLWSTTPENSIKMDMTTAYWIRYDAWGTGVSDEPRGIGVQVRCVR